MIGIKFLRCSKITLPEMQMAIFQYGVNSQLTTYNLYNRLCVVLLFP